MRPITTAHVRHAAIAFPSRPGASPGTGETSQVPRKELLHVHKVSDCARFFPCKPNTPWDDVAFSSAERDRHLGIRPVSQLNTWPVVSPVNASRLPSRAETSCITRGRGGWLNLPRGGLPPPILCQLPGALSSGSSRATNSYTRRGGTCS